MRFAETDGDVTRMVSEADNLSDLASRIQPEHRELYSKYGHTFQEAAFFNRRFVIVRCKGKTREGPKTPEILGAVRILSFEAQHETGCRITLMDEGSSRTTVVDHVPRLIFRYPVFVSIPIYQGLKWEAKEMPDGSYKRALVFGMCFKQQSKVDWFNPGNVCIMTHNVFTRLFGAQTP